MELHSRKKKPDTLVNRTEKPGVDSNKSGGTVMYQKGNRVHVIIGGAFQGKTQYATKNYPRTWADRWDQLFAG